MRTLVDGVIGFFTSLRLTVVLLGLAIVLVFIGTIAQVDEGLYAAQARYFRQWFILGFDILGYRIPLPLPGGYLIGTMLLINLTAAHVFRFQLSWKKVGIQIVHAGVILLLVGQLVTDMFAHESQIQFKEGEARSYAESSRNSELAFTLTSAAGEDVIVIPGHMLTSGSIIDDENLPFTIQVKRYFNNSNAVFRAPMNSHDPPVTSNGIATSFDFEPVAESRDTDEKNVPTALIELTLPKGGSLGTWVVSEWATDAEMIEGTRQSYEQQVGPQMAQTIVTQLTRPQVIQAGGKSFTVELRPQRIYFPFSLKLLKATHTVYQGTDIPKDFRSRVELHNSQTGEQREVEISMNNPLRYAGLTFYQYQMDAGQAARQAGRTPSSVLQVVHNPGWLTPYVGCGMVAIGLCFQFLYHLTGFLSKRRTT